MAPVVVPERLARPQLLVPARRRLGRGGAAGAPPLASSFEKELQDALAAGISTRLGAIDVTRSARSADRAAWRLSAQLRRFDAVRSDRVEAAFSWSIRRPGTDGPLVCQWSSSQPLAPGVDAVADGVRRIVDGLAGVMAAQVSAMRQGAAACPAPEPHAALRAPGFVVYGFLLRIRAG